MFDARAVVLNTKVYVGGGCFRTPKGEENIYAYNPITDTWEMFQGPIRYSALAINQNKLLLVGGLKRSTVTNHLWVYEGEQTWTQPLPPMPTRRSGASAVVYQDYLIVAGGLDDTDKQLDTVEVFNGLQWSTTDPLPYGSWFMKATVHDGYYYLMGGNEQSSVFYASLQELIMKSTYLHHCRRTLQALVAAGFQARRIPRRFVKLACETLEAVCSTPIQLYSPLAKSWLPGSWDTAWTLPRTTSVWKMLTDTPHECSSAATFGGALVAVGGKPFQSTIHMYVPLTQSWVPVGKMPLGLEDTLTITLPTGELLMIAGTESYDSYDKEYSTCVYKAELH